MSRSTALATITMCIVLLCYFTSTTRHGAHREAKSVRTRGALRVSGVRASGEPTKESQACCALPSFPASSVPLELLVDAGSMRVPVDPDLGEHARRDGEHGLLGL